MAQRLGRVGIVRRRSRRRARRTRRDAAAQRLRHVRRLRAADRGLPRGRHPDRRPRAPVAHAPGLVGRREDARTSSSGSRASGCRSTSPRRTLVSGHLMPPEIVDLNDYQVADWPTTPEGEARQADEVEAHYSTLLAHPAVEAITWWGFPDGGWLERAVRPRPRRRLAEAGLRAPPRADQGRWWLPPTTMRTDDAGRVRRQRVPRRLRGRGGDRAGSPSQARAPGRRGRAPGSPEPLRGPWWRSRAPRG